MPLQLTHYHPPKAENWQGRKDTLPLERYFQHVQLLDLQHNDLSQPTDQANTILLGFCSDTGVKRNEGKTGAANGPHVLRQQLGKLACHHQRHYIDIGNIHCEDGDLETAQAELGKLVDYCHQRGYKTFLMGGGHEIAWGHFQGLEPSYADLAIINFDAHFDLRPTGPNHASTSGTPFWQIAQCCANQDITFNYACLGIQPLSNTNALFNLAEHFHVTFLTAEQIYTIPLEQQLKTLDHFMQNISYIYLTICLDVFNQAIAPGVSAPQALGLYPWHVIPLLKYLLQTGKVVSIDFAELAPDLDQNHATSRLAASIAAMVLENFF